MRTFVGGRYKFTRYFTPLEHQCPTSIEEQYRFNDVELFNLEQDPDQAHNLAADLQGSEHQQRPGDSGATPVGLRASAVPRPWWH